MSTINNTNEDRLRAFSTKVGRALIFLAIIFGFLSYILSNTIREETKQETQIEEIKAAHSDKGIIEENEYLNILIVRK